MRGFVPCTNPLINTPRIPRISILRPDEAVSDKIEIRGDLPIIKVFQCRLTARTTRRFGVNSRFV